MLHAARAPSGAPQRCRRVTQTRTRTVAPAAATRRARRGGRARALDGAAGGADDVFALLQKQLSQEIQRRRGLLLFEEELAKEDSQVDVARAALFIAMHRTPELDVAACIAQLDDMGRALEARLPPPDERYTRRMLLAINAFMFEELGFRGADKTAFYVTENSCLDVVLATRRGIPLTLSLVYIELARRVRLPMVGVNIPAHYLIRPAVEDIEVLVDPFNAGALICVEDAEALLAPMYGTDAKVEIDRSFFRDNEPKPRSFLTRMLTNLKQVYFNDKQYESALLMIDYQRACAPDAAVAALNTRDRGICLYLSQRYGDAVVELEGYLEAYTEAVDREAITTVIDMCRTAMAAERRLGAQPPPEDSGA